MAKTQVPDFSKEAIVTSVGVTVVQALDFLANEMSISEKDTQQLWSPFLAATARLIKPADDMAALFVHSSKTEKVKTAISREINTPNIDFYEPFNDSLQRMLKIMAESVAECSYQVAIDNNGAFSKPNMADDLLGMVNFYMDDQNSKGRKIHSTVCR